MCGCIPFCCCMKNMSAKIFCYIGIGCNVIKLLLSILGTFLFIKRSVLGFAFISSFFEISFYVVNIAQLIIITIFINNGTIVNEHKTFGLVVCIIALILSGIIIILRLIILIGGIILYAIEVRNYNKYIKPYISTNPYEHISIGSWLLLIIPTLIIIAIEVIHYLAVNYLYKLIKIPTISSYNEYLKSGESVEQGSVTIANTQINQNPQIFPYNNTNQIPGSNQQNNETETNTNIK